MEIVSEPLQTVKPENPPHPWMSALLQPRGIRSALLFFFFISGACGLIYQVVWLRVLGLIFGNTTFATSTVVAGFMAGLGLGALFFGRWIDQKNEPIKIYGFLEGGIALYSFLTPFLWKLIEIVYIYYHRAFEPSFFHFSLVKFILSFAALLFPTFLMGGTLPVLSKYFVKRDDDVARPVGLLYAWNTLGAVSGVIFSGFFALYVLGVWQTVFLAGTLNLLIFLVCVKILAKAEAPRTEALAETELPEESSAKGEWGAAPKDKKVQGFLLTLFAVSGAVSMFYEIAWTRVLAIVLGSSVYAFSVMLATFLTGISLGSFLLSRFSKKFPVSLSLFAILQMLTALFAVRGLNQFDRMPYYFVKLFEWTHGALWLMELGKFFLCGLVMLMPTVLIGALFACFIHIYHHTRALGKEIGTAYFSNTVGNIFGAVFTGFFIIPRIGIENTLMMASAVNALIGLAAFLLILKKTHWKSAGVFGLTAALVLVSARTVRPWDKAMITSGAMVRPYMVKGLSQENFEKTIRERQTLYYKEGTSATVNVTRTKDNLSLAVNGKVDASNGQDAFNQYLLGHLPVFMKPDAKNVMIIGLGSASTVAAVASHPVESIDVVEIEEAVVKAAGYFPRLNRDVLKDKRVKLSINDGRNFLLISEKKYDIIISEPSNPWMAGVANLFSYEHYRTMKKRLTPGGIVCQWLHAYSMSADDLKMIIQTFTSVYPEASLWVSNYPDLLLIGREEAKPLDLKAFREIFNQPSVRQDFAPYGIPNVESFFSSFWLGNEDLQLFATGGRVNSDNHPYLEFSAPRNLYRDTVKANFEYLNSFKKQRYPAMTGLEPPLEQNGVFHSRLALGYVVKRMYREAQTELDKAHAINPEDAEFTQNLGILLYQQGLFDPAAVQFLAAEKKDPGLSLAHYYLGLLFKTKSQPERAAFEFDTAASLDRQNPVYLKALGDSLFDSKQYALALEVYGKYLQIEESNFDVLGRMTDIAFEIGDPAKQEGMVDVFLKQYPRSFAAYEKCGRLFEERGLFPQAIGIYRAFVKQFPEEAIGYLALGRLFGRMGDASAAKRALERAVRLNPKIKENAGISRILKTL